MARFTAIEDLKYELIDIKKRLQAVTNENYLMKVKIRKLENELCKKNKQIECLLDPAKTTCIRKIVSERGATMLINLKEQNKQLEAALLVKDNLIRKLQSELKVSRIYKNKDSGSHSKLDENKHIPLKYRECNHELPTNVNKFRSRSLSITPVPRQTYLKSSSDVEMKCIRLAENLQRIKNTSKQKLSSSSIAREKNSTPELHMKSPTKRRVKAFSANGTKHNEKYFENIAQEMETIRNMVEHLTEEQENTKKVLKDKNRNIELLTRKVICLRRDKSVKNIFETRNDIRSPQISEDRISSSVQSYSQDSFDYESSTYNSSETKFKEEERFSDDDDVETGESQ